MVRVGRDNARPRCQAWHGHHRLGISKRFGGIPEVRYKGYMNRRHGLIRQSVLGLQTLSNIVFAMALIMSQPLWAATSPVTIGGPFTLIAPDGTTVTAATYSPTTQ